MATTTKQGARAKFLALVEKSGWVLDTEVTRAQNHYRRDRVQDPHAFYKEAAHGGVWHIRLDYVNDAGWSSESYDDRLRKVEVSYTNANGEYRGRSGNIGVLKKPSQYGRYQGLYEALGSGVLRQKAERLIQNPDLSIWLAKEAEYADKLIQQDEDEAKRLDRIERAKPLPVTVSQEFPDNEWFTLVLRLEFAAKDVTKANGKSNLPALIAKVRGALDDVEAVLEPRSKELAWDHYLETKALKQS